MSDHLPAIPDSMARRAKVAALILQRMSPDRIAIELDVDVKMIYADMAVVRQAWLNLATRSYDEQVAEEIASINRIEVAAWDAWEKSIGNTVKEKSRIEADPAIDGTIGKPTSRVVSREVIQERKNGDPKYLEIALKCSLDRRKLLGLDQPSRHLHLNIESNNAESKKDPLQERMARYDGTILDVDDATTVIANDDLGEPLDPLRSAPETSPVPHLRRS
jgi:hypothetical protein